MRLEQAAKVDLTQVAEYMAVRNQNPKMKCAFLGDEVEEVQEYLEEVFEEEQQAIFLFRQDGNLIGAVAGDVCEDNQTIEVLGPFVDSVVSDRRDLVNQMIEKLKTIVPGYRLAFFFDSANTDMSEYIMSLGGVDTGRNLVMSLNLPIKAQNEKECVIYQNSLTEQKMVRPQIVELHNQLFPTAYYNGDSILDQIDEEHWISYCMVDEVVVCYASYNAEEEGYLDFIGTNPEYQHQGYAKKLLAHLISVLEEHDMMQVDLCVTAQKERAIHLYQAAGFEIKEDNQAYNIKA